MNLEASLRERAALDDSAAMVELAQWLLVRGRRSEAQQWLRNAAAAGDLVGMTHLGARLAQEGDLHGAKSWLERAAEAGQATAMVSLGMVRVDIAAGRHGNLRTHLLPRSGPVHDRKTRHWWRRAAEAGDPLGMFLWSVVCARRNRPDDSLRWREAAAECRDPAVLRAIGDFCRMHNVDDAEPWYDRAVSADGDPIERSTAAARLAELLPDDEAERRLRDAATSVGAYGRGVLGEWLERRGQVAEAEECYRAAAEQGSHRAMNNLAAILLDRAETGAAERWFRLAADDGFAEAMSNLAAVHLRRGDQQSAAFWLIRAVGAENDVAWPALRQMLTGEGLDLLSDAVAGDTHQMALAGTWLARSAMTAEAEPWLRRAAAAGDPDGMDSLGFMLSQRPGGGTEAEAWLGKAVDAGSVNACCEFGVFRERQQRYAEAEELYARAARAGHVLGMTNLASLLEQRDELTEAEHWYRQAADHDHPRAMSNLGRLLELRADHGQAEHWFLRAARTGDADAMHNLGAMYGRRGDEQLARLWYVKAAKAGSDIAKAKITGRF
ncbi:tetratricopeptide repeat protein [Micromonospora sp. LOL_023]|uniref:tetratricopeptide repeat protein n=1 Tax=Micromonospora sp. LOL_023 TaxID=3345418 RepID=UPI003A8BC051